MSEMKERRRKEYSKFREKHVQTLEEELFQRDQRRLFQCLKS